MNITDRVRWSRYGLWFLLLGGLTLVTIWIPWANIPAVVAGLQKQLHVLLTEHISRVGGSPWKYGTGLILISFLYGVLHAAGPGHGKVVVAGYLGTQNNEQITHGIKISFLASLLQAIVAIVLVTGIAQLLYLSPALVKRYETGMEMAGYILVVLLGGVIILRALVRLYRQRTLNMHRSLRHQVKNEPACKCQHHYVANSKQDTRQRVLVILSMGLRPCTGALVVLMYAYMVNVYIFGVAAVLAMGIGTGLTVALIASLTILFRDRLTGWIKRGGGNRHNLLSYLDPGLMLLGGLVLVTLGLSLLSINSTIPVSHPLL